MPSSPKVHDLLSRVQETVDTCHDDPWNLPEIVGNNTRSLYVTDITESHRAALENKGYHLVDVRTLPRSTREDARVGILAWLQGMSEGTIPMDEARRRNLELEAKMHGLLISKSVSLKAVGQIGGEDLEDLLEVSPKSRATHIPLERLQLAEKAGLNPTVRLSRTIEDEKPDGSN